MQWGFFQKSPNKAFKFLDELDKKAHTWSAPRPTKTTFRTQPFVIFQLREEDSLKAQLVLITRIYTLKAKESRALKPVARIDAQACSICCGVDHLVHEGGRVQKFNSLGKPNRFYPSYSDTYNKEWHNHLNLSWRNN